MLASLVRTLVHSAVKYNRPPASKIHYYTQCQAKVPIQFTSDSNTRMTFLTQEE